jgi:hypothetical protein
VVVAEEPASVLPSVEDPAQEGRRQDPGHGHEVVPDHDGDGTLPRHAVRSGSKAPQGARASFRYTVR